MLAALLGFDIVFCLLPSAGDPAQGSNPYPGIPAVLPAKKLPFPQPFAKGEPKRQFAIRGSKGWGWTPDQYLQAIPVMAKCRMNFLMNCYLSMFTDPEKWVNNWWEPIPDAKKRAYENVVRECRKHGIEFCFAIHPQLGSSRPYDFGSEKDFADLWRHYEWMQGLGVHWFSVSLDDIPVSQAGINFSGSNHAKLVDRLIAKLRERDPHAQMVFCPTRYWGSGDTPEDKPYLATLAKELDPAVYLFWTGDGVYTAHVTRKAAETYKGIVKHKLILWDNFPVNDRNPALHLGPPMGRDKDLCEVLDGYMSNPMARESGLNALPMMACGDYAYNPGAYDPERSIGQAILHLADTKARRDLLLELVALYPGPPARGMEGGHFIWPLEDLRVALSREAALRIVERVRDAYAKLEALFPSAYGPEKATMKRHIELLGKELEARFGKA